MCILLSVFMRTMMSVYRSASFLRRFVPTLFALVLALAVFARFLTWVEGRAGVVLADPVLALLPPVDVTWLTLAFIYCAIVLALVYLLRHPDRLLIALQSYVLLLVSRMAAMYLLPLDPPATMIPLHDPLVELFGSGGVTLSRDLFFSGHTSTLFLLALTAAATWLRAVFLVCTLCVAVCVLVQHVHYSVDVLAAPFFTWACFSVVIRLQPQSNGEELSR